MFCEQLDYFLLLLFFKTLGKKSKILTWVEPDMG